MGKLLILLTFAAASVFAQDSPAPPLPNVSLPTYIMAGLTYNQYTGGAGFVSGIIPEKDSLGLYGSATTDVVPIKILTSAGKSVYLLSASVRAGQHKVVFNDGKNMLLLGGDFGASFSSTSGAGAGVTVGLAGSFTATYVRQLSTHFAIGIPIRMLWMSGVAPNGAGAWNPVGEIGIIWKP